RLAPVLLEGRYGHRAFGQARSHLCRAPDRRRDREVAQRLRHPPPDDADDLRPPARDVAHGPRHADAARGGPHRSRQLRIRHRDESRPLLGCGGPEPEVGAIMSLIDEARAIARANQRGPLCRIAQLLEAHPEVKDELEEALAEPMLTGTAIAAAL